jgi:hypothetical protein
MLVPCIAYSGVTNTSIFLLRFVLRAESTLSCHVVSCRVALLLTPAGIFAFDIEPCRKDKLQPADMTGHWTLSFCPSFLHCCMQAKDMYVRFALT